MMQGVNIEDVKNYNRQVKEYRDKASKVQAGIEFNQRELEKICSELSAELGRDVTPENIEQVRDEVIAKVTNTITVGNDIINRIKNEEAIINSSSVGNIGVTPGANVTPGPARPGAVGAVGAVGAGGTVPPGPVAPEPPKSAGPFFDTTGGFSGGFMQI